MSALKYCSIVVDVEGELPVLQAGGEILTRSSKILDYLREKVLQSNLYYVAPY